MSQSDRKILLAILADLAITAAMRLITWAVTVLGGDDGDLPVPA